MSKKGVEEQCRYMFRIASGITEDEKKFHFVHSHVLTLEECMPNGEEKNKLLKALTSWALKEFNSKPDFQRDVRMLDFWKLLGTYSEDMKMEGVLENVHRIGLFKTEPAFYLMWAEHWAGQGNRRNFEKTVQLCETQCGISPFECSEMFKPLVCKYFGGESAEDGNTMALIKMLAARPEDVRKDLSMFPEHTVNLRAQKQHQQVQPELQHKQLPSLNRDEFSVFHDPTTTNMLGAPHLPTKAVSTTTATEPPKSQQPTEKPEPDLFDQITTKAQMQSMLCGDLDDITVSGAHGKFTPMMFTSTPRRSVAPCAFDPILDDGEEGEAGGCGMLCGTPLKGEDVGGLFAAVPKVGGSKLQRRLSLAPDQEPATSQPQTEKSSANHLAEKLKKASTTDIVKALPLLKIGSTIEEEDEEKENLEKSASFASPDRKKKRQALPISPSPLLKNVGASPEEQHQSDPNQSTHRAIVVEKIRPGTVNPWNEEKRQKVLRTAPVMVECHEFLSEKCPQIVPNKTVNLGGEFLQVEKLLGEGGFARVYKASSQENGRSYAIKYEAPSCQWEVYICAMLKRRIAPQFLVYMMEVRDAYIFANASAIVYDLYPSGTLLDLSNVYKKNGAEMGGMLVTFFGIQLARALEQVHEAANIIHADVKPDNVVLLAPSFNGNSLDQLLNTPMLKLIDWGRSIDMTHFKGIEFVGRAGTEHFDCTEMSANIPWTFQTDFFGYCASVYVLMKGEYLVTYKFQNRVTPIKPMKRRMALFDTWLKLFDDFLNIPNCKQLPKWSDAIRTMETRLRNAVIAEPLEWKKALERFNAFMKMQ